MHEGKRLRGTRLLANVVGCALLFGPMGSAIAQDPVAPQTTPAFDSAQARLRDADSLKALSEDGQILYQRERIKLDGYRYCSQSVAAAERGDFRESVRAASKALYLGEQQGNEDLMAVSKRDLAIAYSYAGDLERAKQYAQQALGHQARNPAIVVGPAYKTLADVAVRQGKLGEAIDLYNQAAANSSDRYLPLVKISLANAYVHLNDAQKARARYDQIAPPPEPLLALYQRGLGNLLLIEGKPTEALLAFETAALSAKGPDAVYHRLWAVEGIARSQLEQGNKAAALARYVEAAQLADGIRSRFRSEEFKTGLFGDVQTIFERAIGLLAEAGDYAGAWQLSEQSRSRALLDVLRERVALPAAAEGRLAASLVKLADVTAALRPGEALLQFHSLEDRLIAWIITSQGLRGTSLSLSRADLDGTVGAFRQAIFERRATVNEMATLLYTRLLAPLALPAGDRLVIVPHGAMHYLPFQALRSSAGFLIESHALALAPSASIAVQFGQRSASRGVPLIAFGNPANDSRLPLPGAEREVQLISGLYPEGRVFVQRQASRSRFQEQAGAGRILHVAAHAEVDILDPLASRIVFASEAGDPGFVAAREIYGIDLGGVSLVTLSACQSGLGRIARGDEILGFTRSFMAAGASSLLVSLWPVSDESTELLMAAFYGQLAQGTQAIEAMRSAQMAVLRTARFAHPFYWAAFNLMGDWRLGLPA